jgi:RimJ/RimL family protein N-acetyltransferase
MTDVILVPVEQWAGDAVQFLYQLLGERRPEVNISHKAMPTFAEHEAFVQSSPYAGWWLIAAKESGQVPPAADCHWGRRVGACYLTKQNEIGIQVAFAHQSQGYARTALNTLIEMHRGRRLLANIAPGNEASQRLFAGFGFKHIQNTFSLEPE